jgi:4-amino-4-deoxy-L-arabinose transferase-like glycosyltransferase
MLQGDNSESPASSNPLRHRFFALAFLVIITTGSCWFNYRLHFNGFIRNDNHEYCEIARNFYEGNGYSTTVLRPLAYKYFQTLPQPEVMRMPVYPYMLSLFFHIFGPNDIAVVIFNSLFYILLVALTFLLSVELSGNIFVSTVAALMTASIRLFFADTITAEPNIFYTTMFLFFIYVCVKFPNKLLIHGVLLSMLYLARANTLFVWGGFCIALFLTEQRWKEKLSAPFILTAGFVLGLVPYMIRNYLVIGAPFFSLYKYSLLLMTKGFPAYSIWTIIPDIDPVSYALSHLTEMIQKSYRYFFILLSNFLVVYNPIFLLLTVIGFFSPLNNPRMKLLKIMIIAGFISQTIFLLPVGPVTYYYVFFFPLMLIIAVNNTRQLLQKNAPAVLCGALGVFLFIALPYWNQPRQENPYPSIGRQIAELTDKKDIIMSDIAWEIAWYADRRTIWLTHDVETLGSISRTLKPKYIMVAGYFNAPSKDNFWPRFARSPELAETIGYQLVKPILFEERPIALLYKSMD